MQKAGRHPINLRHEDYTISPYTQVMILLTFKAVLELSQVFVSNSSQYTSRRKFDRYVLLIKI